MKQLDQLPEIANRSLGGRHASPEMRYAIQMKAARQQKRQTQAMVFTKIAAPVLCAAVLLALFFFPSAPLNTVAPPSITSLPLGQLQAGDTNGATLLGEVSVSNSRAAGDSGIWSSVTSGTFPLIGVKGRYYRMLSSPSAVSASSALQSLGIVEEYTTEPSLSDTGIISSNCVSAGDEVYTFNGYNNTFVCAKVNGEYRLFQRVSFNGHATLGKETLIDTLSISGHIQSMSISGIGTVSDSSAAENLFRILTDNATYESSGSIRSSSILTITLSDGISAQMLISEDRLAACGVWSCPEFISAFSAAVN